MGYTAFKKGNVVNPFRQDTLNYKEYERGFNVAYYDNLEEVTELEGRGRKATQRSKKVA